MLHIYCCSACLDTKFQQNILTIALVTAKFKYLTIDPLVGVYSTNHLHQE